MTDTSSATTTSASLLTEAHTAATWATQHRDETEQGLMELLRIPSISTQPEHDDDCHAAADLIAHDMDGIGLTGVRIFETEGHPLVYGECLDAGPDAPTILVYGHYDVQPPDPLDEWRTPPFEPTAVDGNVYARGASDDKGQLFIHLRAIEAWFATAGRLPINVKLLMEGEEESGSVHLAPFAERWRELLTADVCVISDSHMLSASQPSLVRSLRGLAYTEIVVDGPTHDLHSGTFGGAVANPGEVLARIIASLKDDDGRILVPGFYDDVVPLTEADREENARVPFDEAAFRAEAGIDMTVGEIGYTAYEQVSARPTLEVNGMLSGYTGEGAKTVLPARAMAKVSMRLVPNQRWATISDLLARHVLSLTPPGCRVTVTPLHGGDPSSVDTTHPAMAAATRSIERVFGTTPVFAREGGSIPVVTLVDELLSIPTVLMGFGLPDDRLHSPNEKFSLSQLHRGIETVIHFLAEMAVAH